MKEEEKGKEEKLLRPPCFMVNFMWNRIPDLRKIPGRGGEWVPPAFGTLSVPGESRIQENGL